MRLWVVVCCLFVFGAMTAVGQEPPASAPPSPLQTTPTAPAAGTEQPVTPTPTPTPTTTTSAVGTSPPATPTTGGAEEVVTDSGPTLEFLLIASGGMSGPLGNSTKIDSVKAAATTAFRYVPGDVAVGLRVSGHRIAQEEPDKSCQDSELLVEPAPQGKAAILQQLAGITPKGNRSIAQSLSRAIVDLEKQSGPKVIILITDGAEGCIEQDPISFLAVSSLPGRGYTIHVRGLALTEEATNQLRALALATGGTFENAEDPFVFTQQLTIATQKGIGKETTVGEAPPPAPKPLEPAAPPPAETPIPASPPPSDLKPEPKEPPSVGPVPLPFDANKFRKQLVADILKSLPQLKSPEGATKPPPLFSTLALIIMGTEALLLLVALVAIVILLIKRPSAST